MTRDGILSYLRTFLTGGGLAAIGGAKKPGLVEYDGFLEICNDRSEKDA
jgi:hypothetical protein